MATTADELAAAGIYDPTAVDAADRLALLTWLIERGISLAQLVAVAADARVVTLAGDLAVRPGPRMTVDEAAAAAGVSPAYVERFGLASGLAPASGDEPVWTHADVETFRNFSAAGSMFGEAAMLQFVRVIGASLARIADAAIALFIANVELPARATHASSLALARANLAAAETIGVLPHTFEAMLRAHLEASIRRQRHGARVGERGDLVVMTVGFVDLVGFTPLAGRLSAGELGTLVERFEGLASDVTARRDGRVVKSIGDAVMFVAPHANVACDIALTLLDAFADDAVVRPRGGLARGETLMRDGDYYGPIVNLAARIGDLAVPREILVTHAVVEAARGAPFRFDAAGRRMLKGVEDPQLVYTAARS